MSTREEVGRKIQEIRKLKGLTLDELGKKAGKSVGYLSQLENGQVNPSLSSLKKIADALDKSLVEIFDSSEPESLEVIRKNQRTTIQVSDKLKYQLLSSSNDQISFFKVILEKEGSSGEDFYSHQGMESGLVVQGKIKITVGDQTVILEEGDSVTYESKLPHKWENVGDKKAIGLWSVSPPSF